MWFLLLFACSADKESVDTSVPPSPPETQRHRVIQSPRQGDAFGTAIDLAEPHNLLIGAPGEGQGKIYEWDLSALTLLQEENEAGALGSAVLWGPTGSAIAGAPLAQDGSGRVYSDGEVILEGGRVLGARLLNGPNGLVVSSSKDVIDGTSSKTLGSRVAGLTTWNGSLAIGMPSGAVAVSNEDKTWARENASDRAGFALCAANFDADPEEELVIGAPGSGEIYILNPGESLQSAKKFGPGNGLFGHSLSCDDGTLIVGSPGYGEEFNGAVWCLTGPHQDWSLDQPLLSGKPWSQLGFSVALQGQSVAVGAPGSATVPGEVHYIAW